MELTWDVFNPESKAQRILVVAPSLGGNSHHQWAPVAKHLDDDAVVVFMNYPGHALTPVWDPADEPTLDVVADAVADVVARARDQFGNLPVVFAGLSIGGATALHLARDHAEVLAGVAVLCSAATVGEPERWLERARDVEFSGTQLLMEETEKRWFTPDFRAAQPGVVDAVMEGLAVADDRSYAQLCRALAAHDMRPDLADIALPVLLIAGGRDSSTPIENVELVAETVPGAELHVVEGAAHQVTVAAPVEVADILRAFLERVTRPINRAQGDD